MIIGDGMIAKACNPIDRDDVIFFASGVSDSSETDSREFERERKMLEKTVSTYNDKVLVYFGTRISMENPYFVHKQKMCDIIRVKDKYIILRLSQVVGRGGNAHNFFNSIFVSLINREEIKAYPVKRSLIDIEDIVMVLEYLLNNNLYGEHRLFEIDTVPAVDIIKIMAKEMGVDANITSIEGEVLEVPSNSTLINTLIESLRGNYTEDVVKKYIKYGTNRIN